MYLAQWLDPFLLEETDLEELFAYASPEEVFDKLGVLCLLVDLFGPRCQHLREVLWTVTEEAGYTRAVVTTQPVQDTSDRPILSADICGFYVYRIGRFYFIFFNSQP